jgi:hypothetical protein
VLIVLPELRTGREILFELGFVGYSMTGSPRNPLTHATSVHWIDLQYVTYDGMRDSGTLHLLGDDEEAPDSMGEAEYVVYFRM